MAGSALLASTIKIQGSMTLQVNGDGPVRLLVSSCTSEGAIRGLVRWDGVVRGETLPALFGRGRLAITIDAAAENERYQGIVELTGERLADLVDAYFAQSEQLETRVWLAAGEANAAGMLLQKLPGEDAESDLWSRVRHLASTVTADELLTLSEQEILRRLFHEEDVRLRAGEVVAFRCGCSRATIQSLLIALGREEAESILREQQKIEATCEYCLERYDFDAIEVAALFSGTPGAPDPGTSH